VASALALEALEVIVVDNNSTDDTPALIAELADRHPTLVAAACARPGASAARNHGLKLARGEWIQFLDADDELDADKLTVQLAAVHPATEWIIGGYRNHYADGTVLPNIPHPDPWRGLVYHFRIGHTCANLYRAATLRRLGGWREELHDNQDPNLHADLLVAGAVYHIVPQVVHTYHHHDAPDRVSTHDPAGGNRRRAELYDRVFAFLQREKADYWAQNAAFFHGAYLRALRIWATHDPGAAAGAWNRIKKQGLPPPPTELVSANRQLAYRLLGFRRTEALRVRIAAGFPVWLKKWLK